METKKIFVIALLAVLVSATAARPVAFAQLSDSDSVVVLVNLEQIRTQVQLADNLLKAGDRDSAFSHAFIPHSAILPSIKGQLSALDARSTEQLESALTDYAFQIKDGTLSADQANGQMPKIFSILDAL